MVFGPIFRQKFSKFWEGSAPPHNGAGPCIRDYNVSKVVYRIKVWPIFELMVTITLNDEYLAVNNHFFLIYN